MDTPPSTVTNTGPNNPNRVVYEYTIPPINLPPLTPPNQSDYADCYLLNEKLKIIHGLTYEVEMILKRFAI